MSAGIQVIGTNGNTQIDQSFINYSLAKKGTVTVNVIPNTVTITYSGVFPILAIRSLTSTVPPPPTQESSGVFTWTLLANSSETITYYIFDQVPNVAAAIGLNIYDQTGRLTFSSNYPPMRVVATYQVPDITTVGQSLSSSFPLPYSGIFAACLSQSRSVIVPIGSGDSKVISDGTRLDSTNIYTSSVQVGYAPENVSGLQQRYGGIILLIDVSSL